MAAQLLVLLARPQAAASCLAAAADVAACLAGSRITVLHARHDPESLILPTEEVLTDRHRAELAAAEAARAEQLRAHFERWSAAAGAMAASARWADETGAVGSLLARYGGRAALVVLGHDPRALHEDDREAIKAALFDLRRPVLLVPESWQGRVGRRAVVAWKPSEQAERAVAAAAPILAQAERVSAIAVRRERGDGDAALERALGSHKIAALLEVIEPGAGPAGAVLLREARERHADLLVAGAFSHSRAYEFVLGGVTRHLLRHADLPVLMAH
jgi:nucleotide-binding universal stress UspA family protein